MPMFKKPLHRRDVALFFLSMCLHCAVHPASQSPLFSSSPAALPEKMEATKKIVVEWYPKINAILFDAGHKAKYANVNVVFNDSLIVGGAQVPALAEGGTIHVWSKYAATQDNDDFLGMIVHELTHVVQGARNSGDDQWVVEGIADYVRHKYFARDIAGTLHVAGGVLTGYRRDDIYLFGLQAEKADLAKGGYRFGYTVASTFLFWLESHRDKHIVREISRLLEDGNFKPSFFEAHCGAPLDVLWGDFMAASEKS